MHAEKPSRVHGIEHAAGFYSSAGQSASYAGVTASQSAPAFLCAVEDLGELLREWGIHHSCCRWCTFPGLWVGHLGMACYAEALWWWWWCMSFLVQVLKQHPHGMIIEAVRLGTAQLKHAAGQLCS